MGFLTSLFTGVVIVITAICAKTPEERRLKKIQENKENLRAFWLALILIWSTCILFLVKGFIPWFSEAGPFGRVFLLTVGAFGFGFFIICLSIILMIRMRELRAEIKELKKEKGV